MRRPSPDDPPLPTVGAAAKIQNPGGVRVWCHTPGCARQDKEVIVPWDKIKVPDDKPFIKMRFWCEICERSKTTFQPLWPRVGGMGPEK